MGVLMWKTNDVLYDDDEQGQFCPSFHEKTLNKALLASLNTLRTSRQRPGPDMYPLACGGINYRPPPLKLNC